MIIEHYKNGDAKPVYMRFKEKGRLAPEGLTYVSSWIDEPMNTCYQVMETDNHKLIDEWISNWNDIVDFEVVPVITTKEALERITPEL